MPATKVLFRKINLYCGIGYFLTFAFSPATLPTGRGALEKNLENTSPEEDSPSTGLKEKSEVFDIINSKELEHLFQKNAHLLNRISTTQRRNSLLQKELFSLIEEKSKLGLKNNVLSDEISSLREKVSFFQDKQKQFKEQSLRLKQILNNLKILQERKAVKGDRVLVKERFQEMSEQLTRYTQYREKVQTAHKNLKYRLRRKIQRVQMLESLQSDLQEQVKVLKRHNKSLREATQNPPHSKELEVLKQNYSALQRTLSQQQEGFTSALRSCRKRHLAAIKVVIKEKERALKDQMIQMKQYKEELEAKTKDLQEIQPLHQQEIDHLTQELKAERERREQAEERITSLISEYQSQLNNKEQKYEKELTTLHGQIRSLSDQKNTDLVREREALKKEYEHRIQGLSEANEKKLKTICTEMENDLCSEKRRVEMLKSEKEEEINRLERNVEELSQEVRRLTVRNSTLEQSNKEASTQLKKEISANETVKYQHKQVKELWQNLQTQLEKRNQQVESLQKLNRSLSVQLNERNKTGAGSPVCFPESDQEAEDSSSAVVSNRHPLADIHFS